VQVLYAKPAIATVLQSSLHAQGITTESVPTEMRFFADRDLVLGAALLGVLGVRSLKVRARALLRFASKGMLIATTGATAQPSRTDNPLIRDSREV
jgi:hypothetical protein